MKDKITVLGQEYQIVVDTSGNNPKLNEWDGYHEPYSKKIVVDGTLLTKETDPAKVAERLDVYLNRVYRHEIMHAFFCESGISYRYMTDEEDFLVDWIARQYPKMKKIFEELGVEE